jgi:hypothetical protein
METSVSLDPKKPFIHMNMWQNLGSKHLRMFWNTVLRKLLSETVKVSSHALEKNTSNSGSVSGFLENGSANGVVCSRDDVS